NFDAEAAHASAELGQHFVAGVTLNSVKASAMDGHYRTLHVDEIVLAQTASNPFIFLDNNCATFVRALSGSAWAWTLLKCPWVGANLEARTPNPESPRPDQRFLTASSTCLASAS